MYHTALRVVTDRHHAEDILQEAFFEAFTRLNTLKNPGAFAGWLKQIVIHKSINFINRTKVTWLNIEITGVHDIQDEEKISEQDFVEKIDAIRMAITALPVKYRAIVNLHIFEKMGFEEIAVMMEMPSATVRSQYLRARQKILAIISKQ
jgi:RNA polymerase sigma-70 factor (ECF subfamily)